MTHTMMHPLGTAQVGRYRKRPKQGMVISLDSVCPGDPVQITPVRAPSTFGLGRAITP
jgi:hypothetical protein